MDDRGARARFASTVGRPFELSRQESRWLALGDEFVAFAADDDAGWQRLQQEGWLLDRWRRAGVPAPRVQGEHPAARVQVRERMHGRTGQAVFPSIFAGAPPAPNAQLGDVPLSAFGARLAASYGELARRIRSAVSPADAAAAGLGACRRRQLDLDAAIAELRASRASDAAKAAAERARPWLAAIPPADAVIHADLHFWNLCCADDGSIIGVFDLDYAGIDAAATELLYVHALGAQFLAIVLDAYGTIDLEAVRRAHVREALGHVLSHGPESERHASIVEWVTVALEQLVP